MINCLGLNTRAPYHLLFYSVVFGGSFFHSFIVSPIAFKSLPREEFGRLQNKVFPFYFLGQTISPLILGLTAPIKLCPFTIGLLSLSAITGAFNYFLFLPLCQNVKRQRLELMAEKKDVNEFGEPTEECLALSKKFGMYHGFSTLTNIVSILSLAVYGVVLSRRFIRP